jgi:cobalamin biosynthesis protein CobT
LLCTYLFLGEILSCEENYEHIKGDEEMNEEDEKTHTNDSDDTNDSDGANMNDEEANPDLEWETTALAEAKKLAEIKSDIPYENPLLMHLYTDCRIVDRVVKAWEENESEEPRRKGYMGHLTRIANIMVM